MRKKQTSALIVVTMRMRVPVPEEGVDDLAAFYREQLRELLPFHLQALERYHDIRLHRPVDVREDRRWGNVAARGVGLTGQEASARGHRSTLSDEKVGELRDRYRAGEDERVLAAECQLSVLSIRRILRGKSYSHVPNPAELRPPRAGGRPKSKKETDG